MSGTAAESQQRDNCLLAMLPAMISVSYLHLLTVTFPSQFDIISFYKSTWFLNRLAYMEAHSGVPFWR